MLPYLLFTLFALCLFVSVSFAAAMVILIGSVVERDKTKMLDAFKGLGSCLVPAAPLGIMILSVYVNGVPLVPDLAVSVGTSDQTSALMGGIVTVLFTLVQVLHRYKKARSPSGQSEAEEVQTLTSDVH